MQTETQSQNTAKKERVSFYLDKADNELLIECKHSFEKEHGRFLTMAEFLRLLVKKHLEVC